jgi:molecular chaperone GrpE
MSNTETSEEMVLDLGLDDDHEIEIVEVVGLDEDSPGASAVVDDDPDEVILSLDSPDLDDDDSEPEASLERADVSSVHAGAVVGAGPPELTAEERLLRIQADFENFKKRVEREAEENREQSTAALIGRILPVLDNFERALSVETGPEASVESFRTGVELIFRHMVDELRREGLEPIDVVGKPFDPGLHDAVETTSIPDLTADTIIEELQRGYRLKGRLLRPALVKVNVVE